MTENTLTDHRHFNWTRILYVVGVLGIVLAGFYLYLVIRDTDDLSHDTLPDTIPQLSPEQVQEHMQQNESVILLDVRSDYEWDTTPHAEGATSMPLSDMYSPATLASLDRNTEIIVMCYSGNVRSMRAAAWLRENGFTNISNLNGGLDAWEQAQLPTEPPQGGADVSIPGLELFSPSGRTGQNSVPAGERAASENATLP